jgi:molecular chaperone DnaK (HSP70)
MGTILGIDLGTTNSLAAYLADDGPRIIPNALGDALTPSVVGIDDSGTLLERFHVGCSGIRRLAGPYSSKTSAKDAIAFGAIHATQNLKPL